MGRDKIPGLTIGFTIGDYTWIKGFGYADLENRIPAKAESAYRLASVTKTMTGAAIVQLAEKGKINLDGEIQTYVPYYPKQKWPVTVRQLLVHLGGGQSGSGFGPEYVTTREVVERIAKNPIQNEPGVKFANIRRAATTFSALPSKKCRGSRSETTYTGISGRRSA